MRRFSFLILFWLGAAFIGLAQSRSGSAASGASSSSSAASSHTSGSSGGSSSHSAGGSSGSSHASPGSSHSAAGGSKAGSSAGSPNHGSHNGDSSRSRSNADRNGSRNSPGGRLSSDNVKSKPQQPLASKVNPQQPTTQPHHWLTRIFHHRKPELAKAPKPCVGKNCPPPPPKPCKGKNCPPPPACGPGTVSNGQGGCVATSHVGICTTNPQAAGCPQSLVQNQYSSCESLLAQLRQAILEQNRLQQAMNAACASAPQSRECISLTQSYNAAASEVESLRQRLRACRS